MLTVINVFIFLAPSEFNQIILGTFYLTTVLFYLISDTVEKCEEKKTVERISR
jgi:hypothetical protein